MSPPRSDAHDLWMAIARLVDLLGDAADHLLVIGGVLPSMLAANAPTIPTHWGTNDVDLLLITDPTRDLGLLEAGLERARFVPVPKKSGWQWGGRLHDEELLLEVLCDVDGYGTADSVALAGCKHLRAGNFRGPRFAAMDPTTVGVSLDGRTVDVPTTGLAGYLFAKAHALVIRQDDKDFYDFVYVVLNSKVGDPRDVARLIRAGPLALEIQHTREIWAAIGEQFQNPNQSGPLHYAHYTTSKNPEGSTPEQLKQDAVVGVQRFLDLLLAA